MQVFSTGMRGVTQSGLYSKAMLLAESKLAAAGRDASLGDGEQTGETDDDFRWRVSLIPYQSEELDSDKLRIDPYEVTVEVEWDEGGRQPRIALKSLRLLPRNR